MLQPLPEARLLQGAEAEAVMKLFNPAPTIYVSFHSSKPICETEPPLADNGKYVQQPIRWVDPPPLTRERYKELLEKAFK